MESVAVPAASGELSLALENPEKTKMGKGKARMRQRRVQVVGQALHPLCPR